MVKKNLSLKKNQTQFSVAKFRTPIKVVLILERGTIYLWGNQQFCYLECILSSSDQFKKKIQMKNYNTKKYTSRKDYSCSLKLDTFFYNGVRWSRLESQTQEAQCLLVKITCAW